MTDRILWRCSNELCRRSLGVKVVDPRPSEFCGPCESIKQAAYVDGFAAGRTAGTGLGRQQGALLAVIVAVVAVAWCVVQF